MVLTDISMYCITMVGTMVKIKAKTKGSPFCKPMGWHACFLNVVFWTRLHFCRCNLSCSIFTRGQLWPSGIVVACVCLCVCVCMCVCVSVNHQFVRTITCHPLKLQSPNLDQKCKRPWLRSLLFLGFIDLDLQGQIELKSQNLPHFGLESLSGQ